MAKTKKLGDLVNQTVTLSAPLSGTANLVDPLNFSITKANTTTDGYVSKEDWNIFNNKQDALGFTPYNATNPDGFISGITSGMVTTALGFTPYNATNPSGYITSSALSSYVPYTGATSAVNLGSNNLTIGTTGQLIEIKQTANAPTYTQTGATSSILTVASGTRSIVFESYSGNANYISGVGAKLAMSAIGANLIEFNTNNVKRFEITSTGILNFYGITNYIDGVHITVGSTIGTKFGTTNTQKLSFWNATPIVQPTTSVTASTFVANTSGILNDTATFDGYTIGQVVKALRNMGLLA